MKHRVTGAVCLIVLVALGALVFVYHSSYNKFVADQGARMQAVEQRQSQEEADRQRTFQGEVSKLVAQCSKDKAAYDALPAAQKAKTAAPNCDVHLVQ